MQRKMVDENSDPTAPFLSVSRTGREIRSRPQRSASAEDRYARSATGEGVQLGTWVTDLSGDMGNRIPVSFMSMIAVAEPVGLWVTRQRYPSNPQAVAAPGRGG